MKQFSFILLFVITVTTASAQDKHLGVTRACLDYIEGFYEGDTVKLARTLKPSLYKIGFYKEKNAEKHTPAGSMSYRQALDYATNVRNKKNFAKADAPKVTEVLNVGNSIAAAKVTAWWGIDYILLSKQNDKWMIESVIWEGPLEPSVK